MSRERLAKLLGMLGSDFDGERANAARMIADMAKKEGKSVADYVMSGGVQIVYRDRIVEKTVYRDAPSHHYGRTRGNPGTDEEDLRAYRPKKPKDKQPKSDTLLAGLRWARDFPEHLGGFECEFIDSVLMQCLDDTDLTWKQERVARRIIAKVKGAEGEPLV